MKIKRNINRLAALLLAFTTTGCATIVSGTTQKISVTTQPSGAVAKVDNNQSSNTPAVFTLERKNDHTIEVMKEGYKTTRVIIQRTFNGAAAGNLLIGGIVGGAIDMASGSSNKLIPERVDLVLEQGTGESTSPKFAAQKDQEFYDKNILKSVGTTSTEQKKVAEMPPNSVPASTNFSPKTPAK